MIARVCGRFHTKQYCWLKYTNDDDADAVAATAVIKIGSHRIKIR